MANSESFLILHELHAVVIPLRFSQTDIQSTTDMKKTSASHLVNPGVSYLSGLLVLVFKCLQVSVLILHSDLQGKPDYFLQVVEWLITEPLTNCLM